MEGRLYQQKHIPDIPTEALPRHPNEGTASTHPAANIDVLILTETLTLVAHVWLHTHACQPPDKTFINMQYLYMVLVDYLIIQYINVKGRMLLGVRESGSHPPLAFQNITGIQSDVKLNRCR